MKIDGLILTDPFANSTFLLFKVKAVFVDIGDQGNRLGEVYVNGFIGRQVLIVRIGDLDRAVLYTDGTTRAFVLYYVSGLFIEGDLEVACFPCHIVDFSIGQDLNVGMPADLDQFG
jgi:hypothetical protein